MPALTLFVKKLPPSATNEHLGEIFSEIGPLKNCFVVRDKESGRCRGIGYVTFSMEDDAQRAVKEVKEYDGQKIAVIVALRKPDAKKRGKANRKKDSEDTESPKQTAQSLQKPQGLRKKKLKARLIIRNLSFKSSEDELKKIFSEFGEVLEAKIPLKPDGKMRGFAFVQFQNMSQAGKALAAMNLKEIKGRTIAVDWAVSKDKYIATQSDSAAESKKVEKLKSEAAGQEAGKNKPTLHHETTNSESEEDEEDDDDDDESASGDEDEENQSHQMDSESEASDEDDDDEDAEDSEEDSDAPPKKRKKRETLPSDVKEGKTIFIRNLSFDTEEEHLEEMLLQFGEMNYVRVVMHANTGHSKGCAFAQFKTKEAAEKCISAAQNESESGGIRVDGRKLNISAAVSREDATKFKNKKVKTHTGTRNLYLAREGLIRPGSQAAEGVSEADMAKRIRFQELKKQKLKSVNVFVSKTRLCVHNLPKSVQQAKLREICLTAAGDKAARITECRVMYDKKPVRGQVMGQSLGYSFVEFKEHEHALQALRHLNNNPHIFGPQKRPIVEFSLEDTRKLKLKATRLQNSKVRQKCLKNDSVQQPSEQQHCPPNKRGSTHTGVLGTEDKQQKAQGSQYSGFMTKAEVEHVELQDGKKRQKVLPMPSHMGPKIRHRDKGKQAVQPKKLKKRPSRKERMTSTFLEKPKQKQKQNVKPVKRKPRNREDERFDSLVEQYKKKLLGNSKNTTTVMKKNKWFL